jgi:ATP-dependent Clp protease protease subunit
MANMFSKINKNFLGSSENSSFYLLMDDIDNSSIRPVIEWIIDTNFSDEKPEMLNLMICSGGGSLSAGFALIDVMRGSSIPVRTIGIGEIASAGLMIFMAGLKGNRILTPNTSILSHQYSWGQEGKHHELMATVKAFDLTSTMLVNHYKKCSNLSEDKIKKFLLPAHDVWLSPDEALKYGLCDEIKELS